MERASFDDLIARKMKREEDRCATKEITVPSMGKSLLFERPSDADVIAFMDEISSAAGVSGVYAMYKNMIYQCCPALHAENLREALGVVDPTDTVPKIMDPADVMEVGEELAAFLGLLKIGEGKKVEEEIKNS